MLKIGKFKTFNKSIEANVLFVDKLGRGSGYVIDIKTGVYMAASWNSAGIVNGYNNLFNIDLSPPTRTITIPETTLPEPMRKKPEIGTRYYKMYYDYEKGWAVKENVWKNYVTDIIVLETGRAFKNEKDSNVWIAFFNKYISNYVSK